jgi:hypothetical protein
MHRTLEHNREPWKELHRVAVDSVVEDRLPSEALRPGVRALDH